VGADTRPRCGGSQKIDHPRTVYIREADVLGRVDDWLTEKFAPNSQDDTLTELAERAASLEGPPHTRRPS